jgi:L-arabinose isomerase
MRRQRRPSTPIVTEFVARVAQVVSVNRGEPRSTIGFSIEPSMRHHAINWIAAGACLACAIAYTVTNRPVTTIATLVVLGVVNLAFIIVR